MPDYQHFFHEAILRHYPATADELIAETENSYEHISVDTRFAATSINPIDRRLDFCAYFLALIKTLDKRNLPYDEIRTICLEIVLQYVQPKNKLHAFAKKLPPKLIGTWFGQILVKAFGKTVSRNNNKDGFIANLITDKQQTYGLGYGIDIIECGICKLFNKHNYSKYAPILCEVDKVTSGLAGLTLIRTGTIANGAEKCDFRFKKVK